MACIAALLESYCLASKSPLEAIMCVTGNRGSGAIFWRSRIIHGAVCAIICILILSGSVTAGGDEGSLRAGDFWRHRPAGFYSLTFETDQSVCSSVLESLN